jgi:hypothetical protein
MRLRIVSLTLALAVIAPAAASAEVRRFDRVLTGSQTSRLATTTRQAGTAISVPTAEGYSVSVNFAAGVAVNQELAGSYIGFLDSLPHGSELAKLHLLIADPTEVGRLCGGGEGDGILACYGSTDQQMIVPSTGLSTTTADGAYTTSYVLTHEYGHHVAANRKNGGFVALDYGPKYWASYELVCDQALKKRLFPGDEAQNYLANPGESWAETYARLTFPEQPWTFTELLRPDAAALDAARRDVLTPWTKNATKTFRMSATRRSQSFRVPLHLDGSLKATVTGPRGSNVGLTVRSGSQKVGATRSTGARHTWSLKSGCRESQTETLSFDVKRSSATGTVRLRVSYPG